MQTFSHFALAPCAPFSLSRTIWGFELSCRLYDFHEHVTSLPYLAQVISLKFRIWPP